jgi:uncharacterized membrane protein (UPF0127 family)
MINQNQLKNLVILAAQVTFIYVLVFNFVSLVFNPPSFIKSINAFDFNNLKPDIYVVIGDNVFDIQRVFEQEDREKGLSNIKNIKEKEGMLFIFEENDYHGIWMKDMLFPIDIIWLNESFVVVDFKKNVLPETFPEIFKPKSKAKYVLELNAGSIEKFLIFHNEQVDVLFR